jgi:mannose-6-phosphate isomerase-like protein (cupin superfamily)
MKGEKHMKARAMGTGEGRSYSWNDYLFTVKAGAAETESGVSFMEFFTRKGDEPGVHVHEDEDEIFYVLEGDLTVTCGEESFDLAPRDFIFLPRYLPHGFTIRSDGLVHMLVVAVSTESVENFGERVEKEGSPLNAEQARRRIEELSEGRSS